MYKVSNDLYKLFNAHFVGKDMYVCESKLYFSKKKSSYTKPDPFTTGYFLIILKLNICQLK